VNEREKHEAYAAHTENDIKIYLFSSVSILSQPTEGYCISIQHHNELAHTHKKKM
jgi:hypothetical protein